MPLDKNIHEFPLYISKASFQDGIMRWSAINSDTDWDLYEERMSMELYQKMLSRVKDKTPPPEWFKSRICSDFWCGGIPYLSIAHYSDLNGTAVPGETLEIFIDGNQLKAKGILFDNAMGRAVWKSLKADELIDKNSVDKKRIRISIAFLDLAHKHGEDGEVFERKSLNSICPDCLKGKENKIYLDGYLVHLALTRVPVNPRTIMQAEDIMPKKSTIKTRKDDALSILGDEELVDQIDKAASLETKSDILVEMSDTVSDEPLVEEAKPKKEPEEDMEDEDEPKEKKGKEYKSLSEEDVARIASAVTKSLSIPVTVEVTPQVEKSALDLATDGLYNSINGAIQMKGVTIEQKLESINPALQELGSAITNLVRESAGVEAPAPTSNDQALVLEAVTSLTNVVKALTDKVTLIEEKAKTPSVVEQPRIPAPRSIQPVVNQSQVAQPANPNSVANIVRRSVSSALPLK